MDELSSVDRGDATEAAVLTELKRRGKAVLIPWGDNQRYDFLIDDGGEYTRVQVKTAREVEDGKVVFDTEGNHTNTKGTTKKPYSAEDIDVFIAYNPTRDHFYAVPVEEAPKSAMTIRHRADTSDSRINWAGDYSMAERFK